jgi:hypothetical protein
MTMRRSALLSAVIALAMASALVLLGVAVHELSYASDHPYRYGPAKVIALGAGATAILAVAVALLAAGLLRQSRPPS